MGTHSQHWHNFFVRNLILVLVQMDELYTHIRATASAARLWFLFDPVSKAILSLNIGLRIKDDAFALVHNFKLCLLPDCVPAITTVGLRSYFFSPTAHFGTWFRAPKARTDHWQRSVELHKGSSSNAQASARSPSRIRGCCGANATNVLRIYTRLYSALSSKPPSSNVST